MAGAHCAEQGHALADPGLAWLPLGAAGDDRWSRVGRCYERAMEAGLEYAEGNRRRMLQDVATIVERRFPGVVRWDELVAIHHNDASLETHKGRPVWVHRKRAVFAGLDRGLAEAVADALPSVADLDSLAIARHRAGCRELPRSVSREAYGERAAVSRANPGDWSLAATVTDLVPGDEIVHGPSIRP